MSHRHARTTFLGRLLIIQRHREEWPQAHIAKAMGISRKCVKTWLDRHAGEGEAGLHDRSSRPRSSPRRTSAGTERQIVELRRRERRGPDWLSALDPLTGQVIRASKTTAVRYERDTPGERVHLDVNTERAAALTPWLEHYNTQPRHNALDGHPPTNLTTKYT
ncbi:hypothetical protein GCM10017786_13770 [Amycolatopsis deserti]|uniref:DNA-binding domain-containing protein n=1 Tax=Amycolatopsis deserti TaxID=185696 RepID=A0ABQ3IJH6_9PSEU|nr:hypothetical protein GCM10017786_13770 [Amycolatopsis deserti]